MATNRGESELAAYCRTLKLDVRSWLDTNGLMQKDLATRLELTSAAISANLHPDKPISEEFIQRLSSTVPEFSDSIHRYLAAKYGKGDQVGTTSEAAHKIRIAEAIRELQDAEKEVIQAIRDLTKTAIAAVKAAE